MREKQVGAVARLLILVVSLMCLPALAQAKDTEKVWVLIDTVAEKARVFRGQDAIAGFKGISIGQGGAARLRRSGDKTTPLGEFYVTRINRDSRFHIFFEINYPTLRHAERALEAGVIDEPTYDRVLDAMALYGRPPQDTPLGGHIGIHGVGKGDPVLHRRLNWTEGCVALTDSQVEELAEWVRVGTRIVIR